MQEIVYHPHSLMPYGKYKGKMLVHVPAEYMLWLWDTSEQGKRMYDRKLAKYIEDNLEALKIEALAAKQQKRYERK